MEVEVGFEHMVPTGTSIETKEISRTGASGKNLIVKYHIFVKGAPEGVLLTQLQWPVNAEKPSPGISGISIGKDGLLICAGRKEGQCGTESNPDDPIDFIVTPLKGEPTRFAFVSDDFKIGTVIVGDPIEARDKGCTLNVVRLTAKFELGMFSGSGYAPNSDVHYRFTSEMETNRTIRSDAEGRIRLSMVPFPGKKSSGTAKFKVMEPSCSPEVTYEWGVL